MKLIILASLFVFSMQSTQAGVTLPHKITTVACENESQSLVMTWDTHISPFVTAIVVNRRDELLGSFQESRVSGTKYWKPGVFSVTLTSKDNQTRFKKVVSIYDRKEEMSCKKKVKWSIFR